ncbi:hypothetical protein OGATHE_006204 [Ogataea polymorpha]|uniref:Uncharacterized protein n=1 Tax=Ogataea polymorpha TaxID=460523 RepID=A0A9P8NTM3_9ASCO|nr:hypothetical protein OGATHE_006204 [Ogataea polymorpha]
MSSRTTKRPHPPKRSLWQRYQALPFKWKVYLGVSTFVTAFIADSIGTPDIPLTSLKPPFQGRNELKELGRVAVDSPRVNKLRCQTSGKDGPQIRSRHSLEDGLDADLLEQQMRESVGKDIVSELLVVVPQFLGRGQLVGQLVNSHGKLVAEDAERLACLLLQRPQKFEFIACVANHDLLNLLHVLHVELRNFIGGRVHTHVFEEPFVIKREGGQNLQRARSHSTLVGRGVLKHNSTSFFQHQLRWLRNEQVRSFNNERNDTLAGLFVDQTVYIVGIQGVRTASARNKQLDEVVWKVLLQRQMEVVPESQPAGNNTAVWKLDISVIDQNQIALRSKLGFVKVLVALALVSQSQQLLLVQSVLVHDHSKAVNNSNVLFFSGQLDFVRA